MPVQVAFTRAAKTYPECEAKPALFHGWKEFLPDGHGFPRKSGRRVGAGVASAAAPASRAEASGGWAGGPAAGRGAWAAGRPVLRMGRQGPKDCLVPAMTDERHPNDTVCFHLRKRLASLPARPYTGGHVGAPGRRPGAGEHSWAAAPAPSHRAGASRPTRPGAVCDALRPAGQSVRTLVRRGEQPPPDGGGSRRCVPGDRGPHGLRERFGEGRRPLYMLARLERGSAEGEGEPDNVACPRVRQPAASRHALWGERARGRHGQIEADARGFGGWRICPEKNDIFSSMSSMAVPPFGRVSGYHTSLNLQGAKRPSNFAEPWCVPGTTTELRAAAPA